MTHFASKRFFPCAVVLSLTAVAVAATYSSVDVTLKKEVGPLEVSKSDRVSPTLGASQPTVRGGVAYVGASHGVGAWSVGLSPKLPLSLSVTQETGSSSLNLEGLPLTRLNVATGSGPVALRLPSRTLIASVSQETGSLEIFMPKDTGLKLVIKTFGTGSLSVEGSDVASGTDLSGTFQTANYDSARYKVTLNLSHGAGPVMVYAPGQKGS
jgi:hypothetical protein